ncbi:MAG: dTMP kinase [Planctomycetes bacterium]|nr:dTMP kinase [Planctomycetota bacterium]
MPLFVFEGIDGCGKSTQMSMLLERLGNEGIAYKTWREPGGTALGERIREMILDPSTQACATAEFFAYQLARAQLVQECLKPALANNEIIILDRFYQSTIAYQGYGLGMDVEQMQAAIDIALDGVAADRVFWLKLDPAEAQRRRQEVRQADRIEARGLKYLEKVHIGYQAQENGAGFVTLDGTANRDEISEQIWQEVFELIS